MRSTCLWILAVLISGVIAKMPPRKDLDSSRIKEKTYTSVAKKASQKMHLEDELTQDMYDKFVTKGKYTFIFAHFGTPASHQKQIRTMLDIAEHFKTSTDVDINFALMDCAPCLDFCSKKFHSSKYPYFIFLVDGQKVAKTMYGGKPDFDPVKTFLLKKLEPPLVRVNDTKSAKKYMNDYGGICVIAFYQNAEHKEIKVLEKYAEIHDDMLYLITDVKAVYTEFSKRKDGITLFKSYDDKVNHLESGNITKENLEAFFNKFRARMIVDLDEKNYHLVISSDVKHNLFFFVEKNHTDYKRIRRSLYSAALVMRGTVRCAIVDMNLTAVARLSSYFGVTKDNIPAIRAATLRQYGIKYKLDVPYQKWNKKVILDFMQKLVDGKLKRFRLSQKLPKDWNKETIKILVGSNFEEVVYDKTKDVFVYFHNQWCKFCHGAEKGWNATAEAFKDKKDLVFARIDDHKNNLDGIINPHHPAFLFFPKDNKEKYIRYDKEPTEKAFTKFINKDEKEMPDVSQDSLDDDDDAPKKTDKTKKGKDEL